MKERMQEILEELTAFTEGCAEDMHEPDNAGIGAHVLTTYPRQFGQVGMEFRKLDNAFGGDERNNFELMVVMWNDDTKETAYFNLADLIALARKAKL